MSLVDRFKKAGLCSVLGIGLVTPLLTGCDTIEKTAGKIIGGEFLPGYQRDSQPQQFQQSVGSNPRGFGRGEIEFRGAFGKTYACFATGNVNPSVVDRNNLIGVGNNVNPKWFFLRTERAFAKPRLSVYNSAMEEVDTRVLTEEVINTSGIIPVEYDGKPSGDYLVVISGQRVKPGLTQKYARGNGVYQKIVELPFSIR